MESNKQKELIKKLLLSRMRILLRNPFYGQLLMNINIGLDENCNTAYANGDKICFSPEFLEQLSEDEVDFVLHHEILHIVLKHCYRFEPKNKQNPLLFNIACDMVVDSTIFKSYNYDESKIVIQGESRIHKLPNGDEAHEYTVEQVFDILYNRAIKQISDDGLGKVGGQGDGNGKSSKGNKTNGISQNGNFKDDHDKWKVTDNQEKLDNVDRIIVNSVLNAKKMQNNGGLKGNYGAGNIPDFAEKIYKEITEPKLDWRIILNNFIQEEINDYSFSPPDRRIEGPFFLPDFNGTDQEVKDILFMIDTSGSMSDKQITEMYSEINGAINQFNGKLQGWLGFFDADVTPPIPFKDVDELKKIKAYGGGGTNFSCIFKYVFKHMEDNLPVAIIILTDGFADFPKKEITKSIPVLWILNNDSVKPPYGKVIVIK